MTSAERMAQLSEAIMTTEENIYNDLVEYLEYDAPYSCIANEILKSSYVNAKLSESGEKLYIDIFNEYLKSSWTYVISDLDDLFLSPDTISDYYEQVLSSLCSYSGLDDYVLDSYVEYINSSIKGTNKKFKTEFEKVLNRESTLNYYDGVCGMEDLGEVLVNESDINEDSFLAEFLDDNDEVLKDIGESFDNIYCGRFCTHNVYVYDGRAY